MNTFERNEDQESQMGQKSAGRFSEGKIRYDLVAPWAMEQIAKVYTYGTIKYDDDNWWKGLSWKKNALGCIFRHVWAWIRGEVNDPESGLHHLAHAAWNCMTLMEYERNKIGVDDRIPYGLDLMDNEERWQRINRWVELAHEDRLDDYNGLDVELREHNPEQGNKLINKKRINKWKQGKLLKSRRKII
jgi:hypothetical protein